MRRKDLGLLLVPTPGDGSFAAPSSLTYDSGDEGFQSSVCRLKTKDESNWVSYRSMGGLCVLEWWFDGADEISSLDD